MEAAKRTFAMEESIARTTANTAKLSGRERRSLPGFEFQNGYRLSATDLGNHGIKIELAHDNDEPAAIILPPQAVAKCGMWMLRTLGQDKHGLPHGLSDILRRLSKLSGSHRILERGDKKMIRDSLRALRS
jgi:hypothetical protein